MNFTSIVSSRAPCKGNRPDAQFQDDSRADIFTVVNSRIYIEYVHLRFYVTVLRVLRSLQFAVVPLLPKQ